MLLDANTLLVSYALYKRGFLFFWYSVIWSETISFVQALRASSKSATFTGCITFCMVLMFENSALD